MIEFMHQRSQTSVSQFLPHYSAPRSIWVLIFADRDLEEEQTPFPRKYLSGWGRFLGGWAILSNPAPRIWTVSRRVYG